MEKIESDFASSINRILHRFVCGTFDDMADLGFEQQAEMVSVVFFTPTVRVARAKVPSSFSMLDICKTYSMGFDDELNNPAYCLHIVGNNYGKSSAEIRKSKAMVSNDPRFLDKETVFVSINLDIKMAYIPINELIAFGYIKQADRLTIEIGKFINQRR